jgi:hypothetical protein
MTRLDFLCTNSHITHFAVGADYLLQISLCTVYKLGEWVVFLAVLAGGGDEGA